MTDFTTWVAELALEGEPFRTRIDRLRELAAGDGRGGYSRTTGPLTRLSWERLLHLEQQGLVDGTKRPRGWKNTDMGTDDGFDHVRRYTRGCRSVAGVFFRHEGLATAVHDLVGREGYLPSVAPTGYPAPTGPVASQLAAHVRGLHFGAGATAMRQAWYRYVPKLEESEPFRFAREAP